MCANKCVLDRFVSVLLMGLLTCVTATQVAAAEEGQWRIELEEQLDRGWYDEPLSYTFEAEEGEAHVDTLRLEGPNGPMPMQLTEVDLWPGTQTVRSAELWLMADLEPLETNIYTLHYASEPDDDRASEQLASDLDVTASGDHAEMTTSRFGVRLRLGEQRFDEPRAASDVPGPVEKLRLADGTWFGGSAMHGPTAIRAWSGAVTERGPVFGEVRYEYEYETGNTLHLTVRLFKRADRAQFDADVAQDSPDDALRIWLSRGLEPLTLHSQKLFGHRRDIYAEDAPIGDWASVPVDELDEYPPDGDYPDRLVQGVSPWGPWWDDMHQPVVRLGIGEGERELHVARRDPASWEEPVDEWGRNGAASAWAYKALPIMRSTDGEVYAKLDLRAGRDAGGVRRFDIADSEPTRKVGWREHRLNHRGEPGGSQAIPYQEPLNVVKDYVLDWPAEGSSPRVFMDAEQIAEARPDEPDPDLIDWLERRAGDGPGPLPHSRDTHALTLWLLTGDDEVARERALVERLENHLGLLGDFDKMRHTVRVATLYDALIDSDLVSSEQRRLLRAQMAYLAYQVTHPATWSPERGWNSGNLNMTVSYSMLGRGVMASALSDHPMAERWMQPAEGFMEEMLDIVGPKGEWPESSSYSNLSVGEMLIFGIMATRAGFADYVNDPRMRRAVVYLTKINTPPDPRVDGERTTPRYGRSGGRPWALDGAIARATRETDPEFSEKMQWMSRDVLDPEDRPVRPRRMDLGGFEHLYLDPTLPASPPDWHTEKFPLTGALFRHGFATDNEHYHLLIGGDHRAMIYPAQAAGLISTYAYGRPVASSFLGRYEYHAEFLVSGVSLARDPADHIAGQTPFHYRGATPGNAFFFDLERPKADFEQKESGDVNVSDFADLPRQDYAAVDVAMIRPRTNSLVVPDDLPWPELIAGDGEPPLWWRRQTLFLKDDDPAAPGNYLLVRDTIRGDQPTMWTFWTASEKLGTPEETADREAFLAGAPGGEIVEPRELEGDRFTAIGQWGVDLEYYIAAPSDTPRHTLRWGRTWAESPIYGIEQYQDLLHLQRDGDGVYYLALFPRKAEDGGEPPQFSTAGDGRVIKVQGDFGTDWGFLSAEPAEAEADNLRFAGRAASVQHRNGETTISLGSAGRVGAPAVTLEAEEAATVRWTGEPATPQGDAFNVDLPREHTGTELNLALPTGAYAASDEAVTLERDGERWRVQIPEGVTRFVIERE